VGAKKLHGEQVALGSIATLHLQGGDWKAFRESLKVLGLPISAKEIGIDSQVLIKALSSARNARERYSILDEKNIDEKEAEKILREVEII